MASIAKGVLAALALGIMTSGAVADEYPSRTVRLIAPFAVGGPTDTSARLIAEALGRQLGQTVIVENRSGAGGVLGTEAAARAQADGYTLLVSAAATFTVVPAVKKASYDPMKDFVPLGQIWYAPQALVVRAQLNMKTVAELVAYAKANPGKLTFGSAGNGTTTHLSIGLLSSPTFARQRENRHPGLSWGACALPYMMKVQETNASAQRPSRPGAGRASVRGAASQWAGVPCRRLSYVPGWR